ncbi:hypothetical protein [Oricola sp.]|uniref:hypothetical protein n=1 Tax=Oricola sp. TaxID=1979950 RepID=UPI003BAB27E0
MPPLTLSFDPRCDDPSRAEILFRLGQKTERRAFLQSNGPGLRRSGNALLCLGLAPAMELGTDLIIEGAVSRELRDNADRIQDLLCDWYSDFHRIAIHADRAEDQPTGSQSTGLFYSGGIDSSFSLHELQNEIASIITVIGADIDLSEQDRAAALRQAASSVSAHYGLQQILITTDIRKVTDRMVGWVEYHGAFLAAVGHLLADELDTVFIASSGSEMAIDIPWGSNPILDPLYGTRGMKVVHHTLADRFTKLRDIIDQPALMEQLRVCLKADPNCCNCRKCHFVMHSLAVLDAFDKAPTFIRRPVDDIPLEVIDDDNAHLFALRDEARQHDPNSATARNVDTALRRFDRNNKLTQWLPLDDWRRRYKRWKRKMRYRRAAGK